MIEVKAMMVGTVIEIPVQVGDQVQEEDDIVILESMKMELPVPAPAAGVVKAILVSPDEVVQEGDVVAVLE